MVEPPEAVGALLSVPAALAGDVTPNEGQQSGRSSEQPINGTSIEPPSGKVRIVNCGRAHLRGLIST